LFEPVPTHRPRSDLAGAAAYAIIVPFLAVVICAFSLIAGVRGRELTMVAIATLTLVVAFIPIGSQRLLHPDRRHIFISFICLAFPVYFVLPVFTQYFWGGDDTGSVASLLSLDLSDIIQAQLAALVSLVCLIIGFASPLGILVTAIFPRPRHEWGHQNALIVGVGMVVVGWLTFALGQLGLLPRQLGSGALGAIISSYYFGLALLTIVYLKFQSRQALVVLLALLPLAMLVGFLTGSKRLFLAPAALIALAHMVTIRRARAFWFVGGLTGVVLIYPIASFYREVVQAGNVLSLAEVLRNPGRMLLLVSSFVSQVEPLEYFRAGLEATTNRLNYLGILTLIVRDAGERVPFQGGWTIGLAFISFIPRIFWPGKPATSIGQWVTDNFGSGPNIESSTGPSQIGELFFNFGWPGIVIGWILLGIYFRTISEMFFRKDAPTVALMIAVIALWTTLPALGGTFTNFISGFLFNAGYIGVLHMGVRVFLGTSIPRPNSQPTTSLPFR
jgi:hypothetical protein